MTTTNRLVKIKHKDLGFITGYYQNGTWFHESGLVLPYGVLKWYSI